VLPPDGMLQASEGIDRRRRALYMLVEHLRGGLTALIRCGYSERKKKLLQGMAPRVPRSWECSRVSSHEFPPEYLCGRAALAS
jgi:hypothetical protein